MLTVSRFLASRANKSKFSSRPHQRELFVDFIGWFPSQDYIHFVLEYCPYGDISQQQIPMGEVDAWCICNQLMEGLSVLHKVGIIHRDIKPQVIGFSMLYRQL